MRYAPLQGAYHVVQGGSAQRGDHTNATWHLGQGSLACRIKQALRFQLGLELQKLLKQTSLTGATKAFHNQLQLATWLVHAQAAAQLHLVAIARRKLQQACRAAEHGAAQLAAGVFQRKIAVAAGGARKAGNFPGHRHRVEARLQRVGNGAAQGTYRPDARLRALRLAKRHGPHRVGCHAMRIPAPRKA